MKVGCCGFPVSRAKYYKTFGVIELQSTFYQLPQEKTAERWREEASPDFEFTAKAWQAITHPLSSPTWRRVKRLPDKMRENYGLLRPTRENFAAWDKTLAICRILEAKVCVIQCPPQFGYTKRNMHNMVQFFEDIDRNGMDLAWEPRGNWATRAYEISRLCRNLELIHVMDLLRSEPAHVSTLAYFRMHGLGGKQANYSYQYSNGDISGLSRKVSLLRLKGVKLAYVMFNNISMLRDARRFLTRIRQSAE